MAHQSPSCASDTEPSLKLTHHRALVFDVYGTLVDWESAIFNAFSTVFPEKSREDLLVSYAGVEGKLQMQFPSTPYSKILELAYRQLTALGGVTTAGIGGGEGGVDDEGASTSRVLQQDTAATPPLPTDDAQRFGVSIADWRPFPDTIDALHRLKKHFALAVLSNVDDRSFSGTHARLCSFDYPGSAYQTITSDSPFSLILTAQQVGAYKPNPVMLKTALRQLSATPDPSLPSNPSVHVDASEVLVVANSIRHDIIPSMQMELRNVWISREGVNFIGNKDGGMQVHCSEHEGLAADSGYPYTWRYETLGNMATAVEGEAPPEVSRWCFEESGVMESRSNPH